MNTTSPLFTAQSFTIPQLKNISQRTIEEHLKLYAGYVKHANLIQSEISALLSENASLIGSSDAHAQATIEKNTYLINELQRRYGFEFDGMRNHEYYFASFEGGPQTLSDGPLAKALTAQWGSVEAFCSRFKSLAMTRGIGWAILYKDETVAKNSSSMHPVLTLAWVEEQHLGHLVGLTPVLALDMWEHSYMLDYAPSEKKKYIEAFFENLNWSVIEKNYSTESK